MLNLFELVERVEAQVWGVAGTCRLQNPSRINVRLVGLRQARLQNLFELVGRVEAPKSGSEFFDLHRFLEGGARGWFNLHARLFTL